MFASKVYLAIALETCASNKNQIVQDQQRDGACRTRHPITAGLMDGRLGLGNVEFCRVAVNRTTFELLY